MKVVLFLTGLCSVTQAIAIRTATYIDGRPQAGCVAPVSLNASTNVFKDYKLHPNNIYRKRAEASADIIKDPELKSRALEIANAGQFVWIRGRESIWEIEEAVKDVPCDHILGLVLEGLPLKSCPSFGFGPEKDPWDYRAEFLDRKSTLTSIVKIIKSHPNTAFALIIEPDIVGTLVINADLSSCKQMSKSYREHVPYGLKSLDLPNTVTYLDACHGGCFGWVDNQELGATELINAWKNAGKLSQFRGVAVNVASYNSWDMSPGEMFQDENSTCFEVENPARNEKLYLEILKREIDKANTSMPFHAIMDTSRNAVIGIRRRWENFCNINGAGFGVRPTAETGHSLLDAFVYAKSGGESDGTSNTSAFTYDSFCGKTVAYKPMPERDEWSHEYFEMLLRNAKEKGYQMIGKRDEEIGMCHRK